MQQLTEEEFDSRFTVVTEPATGADVRPSEHGLDKNSDHLWTVVDADGDLYAVSGWHYVNRIGYVITEQAWDDEIEAEWFLGSCDNDDEAQEA